MNDARKSVPLSRVTLLAFVVLFSLVGLRQAYADAEMSADVLDSDSGGGSASGDEGDGLSSSSESECDGSQEAARC